jgi:hypothetical protein
VQHEREVLRSHALTRTAARGPTALVRGQASARARIGGQASRSLGSDAAWRPTRAAISRTDDCKRFTQVEGQAEATAPPFVILRDALGMPEDCELWLTCAIRNAPTAALRVDFLDRRTGSRPHHRLTALLRSGLGLPSPRPGRCLPSAGTGTCPRGPCRPRTCRPSCLPYNGRSCCDRAQYRRVITLPAKLMRRGWLTITAVAGVGHSARSAAVNDGAPLQAVGAGQRP